jgi:hypothetical protein
MIFRKDDKHRGELDIPPLAANDPKAQELARIWAGGGRQHVILRHDAWEDPTAWGLMLVDLAKHVANAYEQAGKGTHEAVLGMIKEGFDLEWSNPTDEATGEISG